VDCLKEFIAYVKSKFIFTLATGAPPAGGATVVDLDSVLILIFTFLSTLLLDVLDQSSTLPLISVVELIVPVC
jgi:hypothetical protein